MHIQLLKCNYCREPIDRLVSDAMFVQMFCGVPCLLTFNKGYKSDVLPMLNCEALSVLQSKVMHYFLWEADSFHEIFLGEYCASLFAIVAVSCMRLCVI